MWIVHTEDRTIGAFRTDWEAELWVEHHLGDVSYRLEFEEGA